MKDITMITIISLVTSVKDYIEVVHKLIESDSNYAITNYNELGSIITYFLISLKNSFIDFLSLNWFKTIWNFPVMVPEISSAMISEISVLDGYFHNSFQFLDTPLLYGPKNDLIYGLEKFVIGLINSCFFIIPTSTAHFITLRRFVMQGLEAGYVAGLGTIAGNLFWIGSIVLGCRFFVIPWLSLDIFRYLLGFMLLIKYMWDSYNERRMVLEDLSKQKIFLLSFLLALTEQTSIYPFISNLSIGPESSILESFPANSSTQFFYIHFCYLFGLFVGSFSLLHLTCWFWENPAFKLYMWVISSFNVSTSYYSKFLNFAFLYLTMICAITSVPYYGLDYTLTNPLGFVNGDRIVDGKLLPETAFINSKASDKNTRRNRGRHGRRERWKRRIRKYRTFDASLYDQGVYDLFTIEDLNYGFDRFWLRRKTRNHRVRFRFFPSPWMRSFKTQLSKPRLESYAGPRQEFFRFLFEQVYHPSFHKYNYGNKKNEKNRSNLNIVKGNVRSMSLTSLLRSSSGSLSSTSFGLSQTPFPNFGKKELSVYSYSNSDWSKNNINSNDSFTIQKKLKRENSTLRKFVRKVNNRIKTSEILQGLDLSNRSLNNINKDTKTVYSKHWKEIFSKIQKNSGSGLTTLENGHLNGFLTNFYTNALSTKPNKVGTSYISFSETKKLNNRESFNIKKQNSVIANEKNLQILRYKALLTPLEKSSINGDSEIDKSFNNNLTGNFVLLHPLKYYLKKQQAFQAKLNYYTPTIFRQFSIENNAPYFRVMMKRYFYFYKPTLRWKKTMKVASLRKARRKSSRVPRKIQFQYNELKNKTRELESGNISLSTNESSVLVSNTILDPIPIGFSERLKKPTSTYTVVGKHASRYRYQIYKDVLQHWYYSPFNRFLLKLDVDSFIRRQPNSHFLTKNEENLIHLRRFLLSEHYNTLRWYTYMQHYRSMKTRIGGTKSFSSTFYNQQFQGTFKKIRHLFAITPSGLATLENGKTVLKFDQPLYNEYFNTSNNKYLNTFLVHEELLDSSKRLDDLVGQSTGIVREYLVKAAPIRQEIIQKLIAKRSYVELTQFLYQGQKTRGNKPITNNQDLYNQEKNYLLTINEKEQIKKLEKEQLTQYLRENNIKGDLWINLLKKWKRCVTDQEFLKNYISRRVEERETREQNKQAKLEKKLEILTNWLKISTNQHSMSTITLNQKNRENKTLSSGTQKAINEGISSLKKFTSPSNNSLLNIQEKSSWKASTLLNYKKKLMNTKKNYQTLSTKDTKSLALNGPIYKTKMNLENLRFYSQLRKGKEIQTSLTSISNIIQKMDTTQRAFLLNKTKKILNLKALLTKTTDLTLKFKRNIEHYLGVRKIYSLILPIKRKSFKNWRKKERALNKQKKSRKELKKLSAIVTKKKTMRFKNDYYFNSPFQAKLQKYDTANTGPTSPFSHIGQTDGPTSSKVQELINLLRKKRDNSSEQTALLKETISKKEKGWANILVSQYSSNSSLLIKQFKRKKSPQRRASIRRTRGITRKRNLADSLKREFRNLRRYGEKLDNDSKKQQILDKISNYSLIGIGTKEKFKGTYGPRDETSKTGKKYNGVGALFRTLGKPKIRSKQKKQRPWKQKRAKYSQKLRKYKKHRRNVLGKIRILGKQLNRVQSKIEIQNWWWNNVLPSFRANLDAFWQVQKSKLLSSKMLGLSVSDILNRDTVNITNTIGGLLQIGDRDFKPLALPQAMRIKENLLNNTNSLANKDLDVNNLANSNSNTNSNTNSNFSLNSSKAIINLEMGTNSSSQLLEISENGKKENKDLIEKLYEKLLTSNPNKELSEQSSFLTNNTSIPFYAGWDESLRKFVVTNRLLSRRQTGFEMSLKNSSFKDSTIPGLNPLISSLEAKEKMIWEDEKLEEKSYKEQRLEFTSAPLKGMNAATTLYWQIPFTTYDPDQFFALGIDGFAPLGWRRFNFRHTILKSWLYYLSSSQSISLENSSAFVPKAKIQNSSEKKTILVKKETTLNAVSDNTSTSRVERNTENKNPLIYKLNRKNRSLQSKFSYTNTRSQMNITGKKINKNISRRLKKRNRRVKKHPRAPVWFPSGPLLNQVLPVHYIFVFYKRSRVPRDRYIKRRLQNNKRDKKVNILGDREPTNGPLSPALVDYTLRKRVKTKRKYHRKKALNKKMPIFPKRMKFLGEDMDSIYWRPMSHKKLSKPIGEFVHEQRLLKNKQRKSASNKQPSLRVRQLRRRIQRQIIRTVWRYKPRAGGFVWPGDYLRLESVKAPKLQQHSSSSKNLLLDQGKLELTVKGSELVKERRKTKRKKKRILQEWPIQPKKYLLEKHNIRVLKKKLEKANRSLKIKQRMKELNYII